MTKRTPRVIKTRQNDTHVRFSDELYGQVTEFATRNALSIKGSVRVLVERGLQADARLSSADPSMRHELRAIGLSALAGLIAAEQNQKLLMNLLPDGTERIEDLWEEAATTARDRLIALDQALVETTAAT